MAGLKCRCVWGNYPKHGHFIRLFFFWFLTPTNIHHPPQDVLLDVSVLIPNSTKIQGGKKMSRFIKVGRELVPVSEEVYQAYYKMGRRNRYLEEDVKVGRIDVQGDKVTFIDSKEDSIQRLMDLGVDFASNQLVEDIVADKAEMQILQRAMAELEQDEQELIEAIYFQNLSTRKAAKQINISQPMIVKKHKKILDKLKKYFS
jgi:RNA polymerase sigma factor (sigma-70 family)